MDLSIIIPYKSDGDLRNKHIEFTLKRYKEMFPEAQIIVSEDEKNDKKSWETFNKSKIINKGFKQVNNNNIFITDIDMIFEKESIEKSLKIINKYSCIVPFTTIYKLYKGISTQVLENGLNKKEINKENCNSYHSKRRTSGCILLESSNFTLVNGYDERFIGWGAEDTAFVIAVTTITGKYAHRLIGESWHLWHRKGSNSQEENTRQLYSRYLEAKGNKKEMEKLIKEVGHNA